MELNLTPRRCLICEKFLEVGELGHHIFEEHGEEEVIQKWPGGFIGFVLYLHDTSKKTLCELEEFASDEMTEEIHLRFALLRMTLQAMVGLSEAWLRDTGGP